MGQGRTLNIHTVDNRCDFLPSEAASGRRLHLRHIQVTKR